jgi:Ca-activated chloride channel family protein
MKYKYSKYVPNLLDELDMDELMSKLSDLLMSSGFGNPRDTDDDSDRTMQALHDAILEALLNGGVLPDDLLEQLFGDAAEGNEEGARDQLEQLIEQIIERMKESGYISTPPDLEAEKQRRAMGGGGEGDPGEVKFEVTDKALDFLGYRALRDLLGSAGHSSAGRHDTRDLSTGIETSGAPKPYEFGDVMNLDVTETILNAVKRRNAEAPGPEGADPVESAGIDIDYSDLMVAQGEYQSSCATVLLLDCSHSMILYGEDRFTPAKRVAMALSHLIRTQYPGDTLHAVLFHDSAEEIPLRELGRVRVGPYYTNTREGLRLARRILDRQRKDMRQIIMINTFMLARDYDLVAFVRRVAAMCRGKAYFTTPYTLGQYVLMDYMDKKTKTIHCSQMGELRMLIDCKSSDRRSTIDLRSAI